MVPVHVVVESASSSHPDWRDHSRPREQTCSRLNVTSHSRSGIKKTFFDYIFVSPAHAQTSSQSEVWRLRGWCTARALSKKSMKSARACTYMRTLSVRVDQSPKAKASEANPKHRIADRSSARDWAPTSSRPSLRQLQCTWESRLVQGCGPLFKVSVPIL